MKKTRKLIVGLVVLLLIISIFAIGMLNKTKLTETKISATSKIIEGQADLINISECSEEFMEEYFEKSKELDELDNKDNILIVTSKDGNFDTYGATYVVEAPNNQYFLQYNTLEEKNEALESLKTSEELFVEENLIRTISDVEQESDALNNEIVMSEIAAAYNSWGIEKMYLDYAIEETDDKELNEVTVAILDTGCDMDLFNQNYPGRIEEVYNVCDSDPNTMYDYHGHGTHIAGTIAEGTPDNVKIIPVRVSVDGKLYLSDILEGMHYVVYYEKADVINMSFGGYRRSQDEYLAIESANQKNIICVAAAGNDNTQAMHYPSAFDNTISIASVDSSLNKSSFSNYGSTITFTAPGSNILSINGYMSGTSMATPHAVSAIAILKSYNNTITLEDAIELLKDYAIDIGEEGFDRYFGNGFISFESAIFCAKNGCDGSDCDEFCIFKKDKKPLPRAIELEVTPVLTGYNYGSINNILNSDVKITYDTGTVIIKKLHELDDFVITKYDPYASGVQTVVLNYDGIVTNFEVTNHESYPSGWEYIKLDENTVELTKYKDNRLGISKLYLPKTIDGYTVVSISEYGISTPTSKTIWGDSVDALYFKSVIAPSTFKDIGSAPGKIEKFISEADTIEVGKCAFYANKTLKDFKGTISKIGEYAFYNCELLKEIKLADTITEIPSCAFGGCGKLETINIPNSINTIGNAAFFNTAIKEINIPEGVTTIEKETFAGCYALTNVTLPETLTEIKSYAFAGTNLLELSIPENVIKIDNRSFMDTDSLESIVVDDENTVYDSRENCNALIETENNKIILGSAGSIIPDSVKVIGEYSFYNKMGISSLEIPEGVTEIEDYAFCGAGLGIMSLPRSLNTIGERAINKYCICLLYTDSYAATYAKENELTYEAIDPSTMLVYRRKTEYKAFEAVDTEDINRVELYHDRATYIDGEYYEYTGTRGRREDALYYIVKYIDDRDSFRYGDTHYIVEAMNQFYETMEKEVSIEVSKLTPTYTIPEDLSAEEGTKLSEIVLPTGFEWMNPELIVKGEWDEKFYARYIPDDTNNYETIENIEITINKKYKDITNVIVNLDKVEYNAFETINAKDISIDIEYSDNSIETISSGFEIIYNNGTDLRCTDTFFTIKAYTKMKELVEREVNITVNKIKPTYEIPTGLEGNKGQALSTITLPTGFSWMNNSQILVLGENIYKAKFTPTDTINYEIIENIDISINVINTDFTTIYIQKNEYVLEEDILLSDLGVYALSSNGTSIDVSFEVQDNSIVKIEDGKIIVLKDGETKLIITTIEAEPITEEIVIKVDLPLPFADVKKDDWSYSAIRFVYKNGYILGTSNTTYEPGTKLTRGMIVTILNRMEGNNKPDVECKFSDVKEGEYYYNSVKWATEEGIIHGYSDGTFKPNQPVTREELAVMLRNYSRYKGEDINLTTDLDRFNDANKISSFAVSSMNWAVSRGVITGYSDDNTLRPKATSTRDVAASMIYKYFKTAK